MSGSDVSGRHARTRVAVVLSACLTAALGACSTGPAPIGRGPWRGVPLVVAAAEPGEPYVQMVDAVASRGAAVWLEADLVKAARSGPDRLEAVTGQLIALAAHRGVVGVKLADELGYEDGVDAVTGEEILAGAAERLRKAHPGLTVGVDVVVPELGCLSWRPKPAATATACGERVRAKDPGATLGAVDALVRSGSVDTLLLSAGLSDPGYYASMGLSVDDAMTLCWTEAARRWGPYVTLVARKALAHPGAYDGSTADAEAAMTTYVDIPLAHGADGVDIWAWRQRFDGDVRRLWDPGLRPNALVTAMTTRHTKGANLWTQMSPTSMEVDLGTDVSTALTTFDTILVASGTG